jgi:hypothetical protein
VSGVRFQQITISYAINRILVTDEGIGPWPPVDLWALFPTGRQASAKARAFASFVESQMSISGFSAFGSGTRIVPGSGKRLRRSGAYSGPW